MIHQSRLLVRSAAAAVALLLSAPAQAAGGVAVAGPCAVAPDREPCAGGACAKSSSKARGRFTPEEVASEGSLARSDAPLPDADSFTGPGTCADPSAGCGAPRTERVVTTVVAVPRAPAPTVVGGPVAAPPTPTAPTPPIAPPPTVTDPTGTPNPPAPPNPPVVAGPPPPPPVAPPAPPTAPVPPSPPPRTPPDPPVPPTVVEPPPGPVLPPGIPAP